MESAGAAVPRPIIALFENTQQPFRTVASCAELTDCDLRGVVAIAFPRDLVLPAALLRCANERLQWVVSSETKFLLFPRGQWVIHHPWRQGTGASGALYLADWEGSSGLAMIQHIPAGLETSDHCHRAARTVERWCVVSGSGEFRGETYGASWKSNVRPGRITTARANEFHQLAAAADAPLETFLSIHGTTREAHFQDHHYARTEGVQTRLRLVEKR